MRHRSLEGWSAVNTGSNYSDAELALLKRVDLYKRFYQRPFLTCREMLRIVISLGYEKTKEEGPLPELFPKVE